jgi:hypothetical protein
MPRTPMPTVTNSLKLDSSCSRRLATLARVALYPPEPLLLILVPQTDKSHDVRRELQSLMCQEQSKLARLYADPSFPPQILYKGLTARVDLVAESQVERPSLPHVCIC